MMRMQKVFISYSHRQGNWVWSRLKSCLEAGGAEVLIDRERFTAGMAVYANMDQTQEQADRHVLVLSETYLQSKACRHEMRRAIARDPRFENGLVIPVRRDESALPDELKLPKKTAPLYVDLRNDSDPAAWMQLMTACGADLGCSPPEWLAARDATVRWLRDRNSVNLVTGNGVRWRELIEHIRQEAVSDLHVVDLERGATASRAGLLTEIARGLGHCGVLPREKPHDLVEFDRMCEAASPARIGLLHFDLVAARTLEYGIDLFAALRNLIMDRRKLTVLIQSRQSLAALLPADHLLSSLDVKTVELKGRP
jgi:hypothetical protein